MNQLILFRYSLFKNHILFSHNKSRGERKQLMRNGLKVEKK